MQSWITELLDHNKGSYVRDPCSMFLFGVVDAQQILRIYIYVLRNFLDKEGSYGDKKQYGNHDSIRKLYGKPQLDTIIHTEINNKRGSLLISSKFSCSSIELRLIWSSLGRPSNAGSSSRDRRQVHGQRREVNASEFPPARASCLVDVGASRD